MHLWRKSEVGVFAGPEIVEDGLVLALDAGNSKKSYKTDNNLLDLSTWYVGANSTTGVTGFGFNETDSGENTLIADTDPFGNTAVIWKAQSPDGANDGGWNTNYIDVDHTKLYRFSVWVNRKVTGTDGRFYLGTRGYNSSLSNVGVLFRVNGNNDTNPYFVLTGEGTSSSNTVPEDEWVLVVGHVWPSGSGTGSNKDDSGVWKTDGTKLTGTATFYDYVWNTTVTKTAHRSYLFYSEGDASVIQHWAYPRIDLVDGTEPSIDDLINNRVNDRYWYDLSGNENSRPLINGISYSSSDNGMLTFDGSDDYMDFYAPNLGTTTTVEMWCKLKSLSNVMPFGWFQYDVYCNGGQMGYNTSNSDRYGLTSTQTTNLGLLNNWKHYVFEMRSDVSYTNNKIYVNGEEQSLSQVAGTELSGTRSFNNGNGRIAGWRANNNYRMPMDCAIFKVYNRALTASEVKQNFNALRGRFGI